VLADTWLGFGVRNFRSGGLQVAGRWCGPLDPELRIAVARGSITT
jgi:hypothetical protein